MDEEGAIPVPQVLMGLIAIGGVGVVGYLLWDWYSKQPGCPEVGALECNPATGNYKKCASDYTWQPTTIPCTTQLITCAYCPCTKTFETQAEYDTHLRECHIAQPIGYAKVSPDYSTPDHPKGATTVEYSFCRPRLMSFLTGRVDGNCVDRPTGGIVGCEPYIQVFVQKMDNTWFYLGQFSIPKDAPSSAEFVFSPSMWCKAVRWMGRADGWTCGSWDPRIEGIGFDVTFSDMDFGVDPVVCTGGSIGWRVTEW